MISAYRAALPGLALVTGLVAFILTICCLLAGTNPRTLPNMQLYTLNTSRIGASLQRDMDLPPPDPSFNFTTLLPRDISDTLDNAKDAITDKGDSIVENAKDAIKDPVTAIKALQSNITDTVSEGKSKLEDAASSVKDAAKNATALIVSTFINETITTLHVQDFYTAHLLTYCCGMYIHNNSSKQNLTYCSNGNPNHKYNTTNSNSTDSDNPFAFIEDMHLPDPVAYAFTALTLISKCIAALYIITLITIGLSVLLSGVLIPAALSPTSKGQLLRLLNVLLAGLGFFCLLIGTVLTHFVCKKICNFFEKHEGLGVQPQMGGLWLGCSIAGCVFAGLTVLLACGDVVSGKALGKASDSGKGVALGLVKKIMKSRGKGGRKDEKAGYDMEER